MPENKQQLRSFIPSRTSFFYALIGGVWILFSDRLLDLIVDDPADLVLYQTYKGWLFVLVTATLLYFVLRVQVVLLEEKSRELVLREKQFRDLVDHAPLPIFIQTRGVFAYLNDEAVKLYGASNRRDLLGSPVLERFHPNIHTVVRERIRLLNVEKRVVLPLEQTHLRLDGNEVIVDVSAAPFRFQGRDGAVVFARNVTEKRKIENELRRHVALVNAIFENSPNLISVFDKDGRFVLVSRENATAMGLQPEYVVGKTFAQVLPLDVAKSFMRGAARVVETGSPHCVQVEIGLGPEKRYYETCLFPVEWKDGEVMLIGSIAMNVTERWKAQEELKFWHDLMQYIIHHDPSVIAVHDRDLKYVFVSQRYLDDYKITKDVIGKHHYEVFPDIPEKWRRVHQRALAGEVLESDDDILVRPDGTMEYTRWQCRPWYEADGSIGGIVLYTEVITRLKQVEMELRALNLELEQRVRERTARLEDINQELEAFSYSVSHDLRAPLRGIDGFSQALLEDYHDRLDDQGRDYLRRVRKASQRMGLLIDDLLKLSRVSRGELSLSPVDLGRMAEEILADLAAAEPDRHVERVIQPALTAQADPALMRIVLENILDNAWKFTRDAQRPRIEFGRRDVDGVEAFFVTDNGAGFDMAYAEKLFLPFQRLHASEYFPGTGVGLATAARIIRRHNGKIWAEAEPDQGATFYLVLPEPQKPADKT